MEKNYDIFVTSFGGGLNGQSEAIKLSISRSLHNLVDENNKKVLRSFGFLTRNSSVKERRSAVVFFDIFYDYNVIPFYFCFINKF